MKPQFNDLIDNLVVTTDRFITGSLKGAASAPAVRSGAHGALPRIAPVPLSWSTALRVHQDISIQASIEYVKFLLNLVSFIYLITVSGGVASITTLLMQANFDMYILPQDTGAAFGLVSTLLINSSRTA